MLAHAELQALTSTLSSVGPDAPTLCQGWDTRHLAAHLYLRGHEPWQLVHRGNARIDAMAAAHARPAAYQKLVAAITQEPHGVSGMSGLSRLWTGADDVVSILEYTVHHEDVRRAGTALPRRTLTPAMHSILWARVGVLARLAYVKAPVGVVLVVPDGPRRVVRPGADSVALIGDPLEQALYAFGRRDHADIAVQGEDTAVRRFTGWAAN